MMFEKMKVYIQRSLLIAVAFGFMGNFTACKEALNVESGAGLPSLLEPNNGVPTISSPPITTYYSNESELTIAGLCSQGATVNLSGDDVQETTCGSNAQYSFIVNKTVDASYGFNISQIVAGVNSGAANLLWIRKTSVSNPTITNPVSTPYYSSGTTLNLTGGCETGSTITLSMDAVGSDICENSQFSIDILKFVDGVYNVKITQRDQAGNESQMTLVWNKGLLTVVPNNPQIVATTSQVFTISGGANSYTVTFVNNLSGGVFDGITNTYTAGTTAGVTDQLQVEDSQGFIKLINIQVLADAPDHFEFAAPSGDGQNTLVGTNLALPVVAKVADQYGNGVPNYSVVFQTIAGDVDFLDASLQITDALGNAYMNLRQGFSSFRTYVSISPLLGILPDVNASGDTTIKFQVLSNNTNAGNFDLSFAVSSGPDNTIIEDFTGDGNKDILVLNKGDNSISVLSGVGNALMTPLLKVLGLCAGPSSMKAALFDGDAHLDLILSCSGAGQYSFMSGNGDGTFNAAVNTAIDGLESFPVDVAVADFDNDGNEDIVMTSAGSAKVAVRMGNGDGTFGAPTIYATGTSPSKIAVGDVDNANGVDFVILNAGDNTYRVFLNNGAGGFVAGHTDATGVGPSDIKLADFNSNGFLDVAIVNNVDNNLSVYLNNLDGTYNLANNTATGPAPVALYPTEISGDAAVDLVIANIGDSTLSIFHGFDNGTFDIKPTIATATSPINVGAADFNNDGSNDIVSISTGTTSVQIFPGQASGEVGFLTSVGNNPIKSIGADVDGDGIRDKVVLGKTGTVTVLKGFNSGLYTQLGATINLGGTPNDGVLLDLNKDGNLDLVTTDFSANAIRILIGDGTGAFVVSGSFPTGLQPSSITSADFNNDGNIDVVVTNSGPNSISFFPGNGVGSFAGRVDKAGVGAQPSDIEAADFNDDGKIDLVIANQSAGEIGILFSNGDGTFQNVVPHVAQGGTNSVVTGFFNGDAYIDVAASNNLASSVTIFLGQVGGNFAAGVNYFSGFDPVSMRKGDLNGDNREDLILANGINQEVTILWGSLAGTYGTNKTISTKVNSAAVEADDVNNDGALDLTVLDGTNAKMKVFLGH